MLASVIDSFEFMPFISPAFPETLPFGGPFLLVWEAENAAHRDWFAAQSRSPPTLLSVCVVSL